MEANLQCPLDPFVMGQLEIKMNFARVREIENHISFGTCIHPELKHLTLHGDLDGSTPLLIACREGHLDAVQHIVEDWGTPVRAAANYYHYIPVFHQRPKKEKTGGATPIFVAAHQGHIDIVRYLISKDADVSAITSMEGYYEGITPLEVAVSDGFPYDDFMVKKNPIVRLLLEAGANPSTLDPYGHPMWHCGVYSIIELVNYGIDLDLRDSMGDTILHHWITLAKFDLVGIIDREKFFVDGVHLLLDRGVNLNARNHQGLTPILISAKSIQLGILELFLERAEIDPIEKIDALKLVGAKLLITLDREKAFQYWDKALLLLETERGNPTNKIPLQTSGQPVEWETRQQLEDVIKDKSAHWSQAMLTGLRIYADKGLEAVVAFMKDFPCMNEHIDLYSDDVEEQPTQAQISDFSLEILRVFLRFDPYEPRLWKYKKKITQELTYNLLEPYFSTLENQKPLLNVEFEKIKLVLQLIFAGDPNGRLAPFEYLYGDFKMLTNVPNLLLDQDIRKYLSASARKYEGDLLSQAYYRQDWKTLRFLLHLRADPDAILNRWVWPRTIVLLHLAAGGPEHPMVLNGELERKQVSLEMEYTPGHLLFDYGADPYRKNCNGKTAVEMWIKKNCGGEGMQSSAWQNRPYWCRNTVPKLSCLAAKTINTNGIYYYRPGLLPPKLIRFVENH